MLKSARPKDARRRGPGCWARHGLLVLLPWALALGGCTPRLGEGEAALALEDIAAPAIGSRLKSLTPRPDRRTVSYAIERRPRRADLYLSPEGARAGVVLVPGVTPQGKDDRRLVALANTLARLRFAVLVPDLQSVRHYQVSADDVEEIADAFRYLQSQPELAPGGRAGIAGISYSAGPVVLAALAPGVREAIDFVVTLGGYFDMYSTVTYITTGYFRAGAGAPWQRLTPDPYARFVFLRSFAGFVERAADRGVLRAYARDLMDDTGIVPAVTPSGLAPDARGLYELATNRQPERVASLIGRLSPRIRAELEALNPAAHDFSGFGGHFILVHGRSDSMIPYTESAALHGRLPAGRSELFVIDGFAHVDLSLGPADVGPMLRAIDALLARRLGEGSRSPGAGREGVPWRAAPPVHPASPGSIH